MDWPLRGRHVGLLKGMLGWAPEVSGSGQVSEGAGLLTLWPSRLQAALFAWQGLQAPCEVTCLSVNSHCIVTLKTPSTHRFSSAPPAFSCSDSHDSFNSVLTRATIS